VSRIAIVDSGSGNLRSVAQALARAGGDPVITDDPDVVRGAARVVVPGQGAFADCVAGLAARGLDAALREVIADGRPYLGICLGMQLLFDESEEHGPVAGLGLVPGRVVRFTPRAEDGAPRKVPHIGWNAVRPTRPDPLLAGIADGAYVYFLHSFHAVPADPTHAIATCDYGGRFCAAIRAGNLFACQFHPEKSQAVGRRLLENFVGAT
jgi:glutamine amidotransferase